MKTTLTILAATAIAVGLSLSQAYADSGQLPTDKAAPTADQSDPVDKPSPLTEQQATQRLRDGKPVYSCPMKTEWFSDQPGQCPSCTDALMKVNEIKDGEAVFEEGSPNMDMKSMPMNDTTMEKK